MKRKAIKPKTIHEPDAELLSADDAIADAHRVIQMYREQESSAESAIELRIPLASFLAALDRFPKKDLLTLKKRLDARLLAR